MKNKLKYTFLLPLLAFAACSNEDDALPAAAQPQPGTALEITVRAGDFAEDGVPDTRATDSGATTTFENGDRIGIIILDASNRILADNIPYRYNNGAWSFDSGNGGSKNRCYYHKNATYIAYFPYSPAADGVSTTDGLKNKFKPLSDQRTEDAYRASDLLTASGTLESKTLSVTLTHAYASVSLAPKPRYLLDDGNNTECILPSLISDVNLTIGDDVYIAYRAEDGSYRCIFPVGTTLCEIRCFYTIGSKTYGNTINISSAVAANTRYTSASEFFTETYSLDHARVGDFYCKRSDNNSGYLIPGDVASLSGTQKGACLGIVMKVGKDGSGNWKDDCDYKQKDGFSMTTIHGYVLALYDANSGNLCKWGVEDKVDTNTEYTTGFYGYKDTQTIINYAKNNGKTLQDDFPTTYHATAGYEESHPAPANSSGWFLPSAGQCEYWRQNRDAPLLTQVKKATGNDSYDWKMWYWSSSENSGDPMHHALYLDFYNGYVFFNNKINSNYVRSCLAF